MIESSNVEFRYIHLESRAATPLLLFPIYGLTFIVETVLWVFRFIVPLRLVQLGASPFEVGVVVGAYGLTIALCSLALGYLSDRLGRKIIVILGLILIPLAGFIVASVGTVLELLVAYVLMGIGFASLNPTLDATVADNTDPAHFGRAFGMLTTSIHMGTSLGPALAGLTAASLGLAGSMYSAVAFSLVAFAVLPYNLRLLRGKDSSPTKPSPKVSKLQVNGGLISGWSGFFASFSLWSGVAAFLPIYAGAVGLEVHEIGSILALQAVLSFASRIPLGFMVDRFRKETLLIIFGLASAALSVFFLGYVSTYLPLLLLILVVSAGRSVANLGSHALIARSADKNSRGIAMGTAGASRNLGGAIGPVVIGVVLSSQGYQEGFAALAVMSFLGLCGSVLVTRAFSSKLKLITN
ncbi:MAG: MFS transporter [Thaumarchaeota archaeon]|nr:MFS transporter [Nitrososphaerota archaeon]